MTLIEKLKQIPDPRQIKGCCYPLCRILFLSLLGLLCGYPGESAMASSTQLYDQLFGFLRQYCRA